MKDLYELFVKMIFHVNCQDEKIAVINQRKGMPVEKRGEIQKRQTEVVDEEQTTEAVNEERAILVIDENFDETQKEESYENFDSELQVINEKQNDDKKAHFDGDHKLSEKEQQIDSVVRHFQIKSPIEVEINRIHDERLKISEKFHDHLTASVKDEKMIEFLNEKMRDQVVSFNLIILMI